MSTPSESTEASRHSAMATVTECHYETGALSSLALGLSTRRHFLITFNYWANGDLHTGQYRSATAVPQGTLFPITYDPADPRRHDQSSDARPSSSSLFTLGALALAVLLLLWIFVAHNRR